MKRTPGEWEAQPFEDGSWEVVAVQDDGTELMVVDVDWTPDLDTERMSIEILAGNAKLIAAAPRTYEKLRRIRDAATGFLAESEAEEYTDTAAVTLLLGEIRSEINALLEEIER